MFNFFGPRHTTVIAVFATAIFSPLLPGQESLQFEMIEQEVDGLKHSALKFHTEHGLTYHFEKSIGLQSWETMVSMRGYGDTIVFPFASLNSEPVPDNGTPTNVNPSVSIRLQAVQSGGTLVSWISTVSGISVQHHLPSLALIPEWGQVPFYYHRSPSYSYFVTKTTGTRSQLPANLSPLSPGDQELIDQFVTDYQQIEAGVLAGNFQDAVLLSPVPPGERGFIRVSAEISDSDRDGIPDSLEIPIEDGGLGTDPDNPDSDGDQVWDGSEVSEGQNPSDDSDQPVCEEPPPHEGPGLADAGRALEVGFHRDHDLTSDSGIVNYRDPQYKEKSHNYPVGYSRNGKVVLSGKFTYSGPIAADLPNGMRLPYTNLKDLGNDIYELPKTACAGTLDDTVKVYDESKPDEAFVIIWKYKDTDGREFVLDVTKHTVYVTFQDPIVQGNQFATKQRQETLFNIGCRMASGMNDNTNNTIANSIYQEFTDHQVARVKPKKVERRNETLTYYNPIETTSNSAADILRATQAGSSGACGAWASLLNHTLRVQGINANIVSVSPTAPNTGFRMRFGIPAQGNQNPPRDWAQHCITESNGWLYEPSHGTAAIPPLQLNFPITLGVPNIKAYEDIHVELYTRTENGQTVFDVNSTGANSPSQLTMEFVPSNN